mgnify:CR=1 FL=1
MSEHDILIGAEAVGKLTNTYPNAHVFFGDHESTLAFAITISRPGWLTYESEGCWIIAEDKGFGIREIHWFCPTGAKITVIRRLIQFIFDTTGAVMVCGAPVKGHANALKTRVLCRAIGAEPDGGTYLLSKSRFLAYNRANVKP